MKIQINQQAIDISLVNDLYKSLKRGKVVNKKKLKKFLDSLQNILIIEYANKAKDKLKKDLKLRVFKK